MSNGDGKRDASAVAALASSSAKAGSTMICKATLRVPSRNQTLSRTEKEMHSCILYKLAEAEKEISIRGIFYRALAKSF